MPIVLIGLGLVLLVGGEHVVRGASRLAEWARIPPVVVGLTIVAFGTSSPELAVAIGAALRGEPDFVTGNIMGSNIYNVLLVLGLSALIVPAGTASSAGRARSSSALRWPTPRTWCSTRPGTARSARSAPSCSSSSSRSR